MANGNAFDGKQKLLRMEFEFLGESYPFSINPERYDMDYPNRVNATYTKQGAYLELFGEGLKEIRLEGTTGLTAGTDDKGHGYKQIIKLRDLLRKNFGNVEDGSPVEDFLIFYNHTDGEAWVTVPTRFRILRNKDLSLLYRYEIHLFAIRGVGDPAPESTTQLIGSPVDTPTTHTQTVEDRENKEKENEEVSDSFSEEHKEESRKSKPRERPMYRPNKAGSEVQDIRELISGAVKNDI